MQHRVVPLILGLCLCICAQAQDLFTPARPLRQINTDHFSIIFPEDSRQAAEYLASIAEDVYDEVAQALGAKKTLRLPVLISPDSELLNGYFTSFPSNRIVLYQAPISPNDGFARYNDELRKLFLHELTHAVSLNIRSPFWSFLASVFSDVISPATFLVPPNFVEGVTVSFESADGFGRAADTPHNAVLQQDIIEGRFKSFAESSGVWDRYPYGIFYIYGGLFSRYLQASYGMESYAKLWKELGKGDFVSGFEGWLGFAGAFERAYGMKLDKAWLDFKDSIGLKKPVVTALYPLSRDYEGFSATATDGKRIFYAVSDSVRAMNPATGRESKLFTSDGNVNRISVSADADKLLISGIKIVDGMPKLSLRVWSLKKSAWIPRPFPTKLREAAWMPDGEAVVACRNAGYTMDIVLVRNGTVEVLFKGSPSLVPAMPFPFGNGEIAFLLKREGRTELARMDLSTKAVSILDAQGRLASLRYLWSDGEGLAFSWDDDLSLYKLGLYSQTEGLRLQETPLSGGVQYPLVIASQPYHVGFFSLGEKLQRFPTDNPALGLSPNPSAWLPLLPTDESLPQKSDAEKEAGLLFKEKAYSPLPWIFLPQTRYPLASFSNYQDSPQSPVKYRLNGLGAGGIGQDPSTAHQLQWNAIYHYDDIFLEGNLGYFCQAFPMGFSLFVSDTLTSGYAAQDAALGTNMSRNLILGLTANQNFFYQPVNRLLYWQAQANWLLSGQGAAEFGRSLTSPYLWGFSSSLLPFGFLIGYQDVVDSAFQPDDRRGWAINASYHGFIDPLAPAAPEGFALGRVSVYLPYMGARFKLSAARSASPSVELGAGGPFLRDNRSYPAGFDYDIFAEYAGFNAARSPLYLYGDASLSMSLPIYAPLPKTDLYARALRLSTGYRAAASGGEYLHSAFARASLEQNPTRGGPLVRAALEMGLEIDMLLSAIDENGNIPFLLRPILSLNL